MYIMISTVYICTVVSTKETFLCSLSVYSYSRQKLVSDALYDSEKQLQQQQQQQQHKPLPANRDINRKKGASVASETNNRNQSK